VIRFPGWPYRFSNNARAQAVPAKRVQNDRICGRSTQLLPVWFSTMCGVPDDTTPYDFAQRLKCSKCGSRRVGIEIAADDEGQIHLWTLH
jgi:hypothetical protein